MYLMIGGTIGLTVNDWILAGLTKPMFEHDCRRGDLSIVRRGLNGNTVIDVRSIRRPERITAIEAKWGPIEKGEEKALYEAKMDSEARAYYTAFRKADGSPLESAFIERYTWHASLLEALRRGLEVQRAERARVGKKVKMGEWYAEAMAWYNDHLRERVQGAKGITNARSFERVFKAYCNDGYASVVSKAIDNDNSRIVSAQAENLIVALWSTNGKPFEERVWELYMEFVCGDRELYDEETGEVFRPEDFRYKDRTMRISKATVRRYLKKKINELAVYADRNGQFAYQNSMRPKERRRVGNYSLSKISMDDVAMSRKTKDGKWVYKYMAVDVLSGYWFQPAYVVGKPGEKHVMEAFRNMFQELTRMGLPIPGELEVEHHLMDNIEWLNEVFPFVRFCASSTEKRAEHNIKALKYGEAKKAGHTVGRWYSPHEAYRSERKKVDGDYQLEGTKGLTAEQIIADDLEDIDRHNNSLHPRKKMFPEMTRKDVMLYMVNKQLKPIEPWYLLRWIGNKTRTSIVNNNLMQIQRENFWLKDYACLDRMKPGSRTVEAYWLPSEDGGMETAYLYQGDTYIGEAENMEKYRYNEFTIERTEEDEAAMLVQHKRTARFDKMVKERRAQLPKVGGTLPSQSIKNAEKWAKVAAEAVTVETEQPENYEGDEFEYARVLAESNYGERDWSQVALETL